MIGMASARLGIINEAPGKVWIGVGTPGWAEGDPRFRYEGYVLADSFENINFDVDAEIGEEITGIAPHFNLKGQVGGYPWDSGRFYGFKSLTLKASPDSAVKKFNATIDDHIVATDVSTYTYPMSLIPAIASAILGTMAVILGLSPG